MGLVLGKITVETPKYEVIRAAADYQISKCFLRVVAEVNYDPSKFRNDRDGGFIILANYIGALGDPQNVRPEKIAMKAPVVTKDSPEKIAMTAAVVSKDRPEKIDSHPQRRGGDDAVRAAVQVRGAAEAPAPMDELVVVKEEEEEEAKCGVASDEVAAERVQQLRRSSERDGHKVVGDFLLARYNPPWMLRLH